MKQNIMRGPLLKAGVVLLIFTLLVYFTSTSAEGSVWSSIAMIFIGAINLIKWAFGMIIGLSLCLAVLIGIFLGAVAMVNKESAAGMYASLKLTLGSWLADGLAVVANVKASAQQESASPKVEKALLNDTTKVDEIHSMLESKLNELTNKIHALESKMDAFASTDKLDQVAGEVNASGDALQKLSEVLTGLETKVEAAHGKLQDISSEKLLGDLPGRVKTIEAKDIASKDDIKPIVDLVERLQTEIQEGIAATAQSTEEEAAASGDGSEQDMHRLFSYFEDVADQERIQSLVEETLKKDMTYAQVMNHLVKEMGDEKGQIISDHPSLAKDYIRQIRRA
ncbi:hypothetical protein [Desulfogranum marinum]|uniref:hypothetical protein n=1 Tax=Desulfogranum marinum TaxID=453220 RepID=UPI001962BD12|nr:hypothetical protein [Desulfogranum marinum]MBM9512393.1 hypothetical protein [Desulfogranum marinum]